jgi:hypothetical protein
MIGHRFRSEHRVLIEPLPERWLGLMNAIHALPEYDDAKQNDAASQPTSTSACMGKSMTNSDPG